MTEKLLEIKDLIVTFKTDDGIITAVDGINLDVESGETLGIVGESGCGKSVTSFSIMQLIPTPPGNIKQGEILFKGEDLLKKSSAEITKIRGNQIAMIFQEPMTSLDPVYTIGDQLTEALVVNHQCSREEANKIACDILHKVGMSIPEQRMVEYPHQLSGGMRQRVMIALAIIRNPELLIADEPTTALDVTIQAQILGLLKTLKDEYKMSIILVTHDLGVIASMCSRVVVMYCGRVVEIASIQDLFHHPAHPYTEGLIRCIPRLETESELLPVIEGHVPNLLDLPKGCRFSNRCLYAQEKCESEDPAIREVGNGHTVACHYPLNCAAEGDE